MLAGVYTRNAKIYHARLDCYLPLRMRGVVGEFRAMQAAGMQPCRKCWDTVHGYVPTMYPEAWEGGR